MVFDTMQAACDFIIRITNPQAPTDQPQHLQS
jgi:hypothetical protein